MNESLNSSRWNRTAAVGLVLLLAYTLFLAMTRIYQVDESQNVFMARVTALSLQKQYYTNGSLILLGPLSWIAGHASTSAGMYASARILFFLLFWLNAAMVPTVAGIQFRSATYLPAVLLVAMLPPLLDYGLEIRHDNVLLALMLLFWGVARRYSGPPWLGFALMGALSAAMQFTAFKSLLYWIPLSAGILVFTPPTLRMGAVKRVLAWLAGLFSACLLIRMAYGRGGAWDAYLNGVQTVFGMSEGPIRFAPWGTLGRLADQTPLLLGAGLAAGYVLLQRARNRSWVGLGWEGPGPEGFLFALAALAFLANPNPYPYNLLHVVPFLAVWVLRSLPDLGVRPARDSAAPPNQTPLLAGVLLFCYLIPAFRFDARHLDWTNDRQKLLMDTAESLTDPFKDRVFDAVGMVPTRPSLGYQWFLHTLVMERFRNGLLTPLWQQFEANPPQVVIRNYRTDWMGQKEQTFLEAHYLPMADDFWVAGGHLEPGGGEFSCLHEGRYQISLINERGAVSDTGTFLLDGHPYQAGSAINLTLGAHSIRTQAAFQVQVVWIGPRLQAPPRIPNRDHRALFVNWY